ncbi:ATPase [Microtetraspora sp. NBRC 13810]|uniref:sensor histidine kinase n=1 Tax=Microtetraspora sp. NBRC 13810 TaxID=3030990 RepID=UPI0024A0B33D|nr:histidine kinase [Microtetraspora sp. NBRC 13810]GLW06460.1 ATPase [Microtetraspora sp. NBRC 13810]
MRSLRAGWRALRRPRVADSLLALAICAIQILLGLSADAPPLVVAALACAGSAALVWRRDRRLTVLTVTTVCHLAAVATGEIDWASLAAMVAVYSVGRYSRPRHAWIAAVVTDVSVFAAVQAIHAAQGVRPSTAGALSALILVGLGQLLRFRRELADRARAELADAAVRAERRRIARELHDVVAHHITTMNVLVGVARTTMSRQPGQAEATLLTVEQTGREAMAEMRQLLHVLRADEGTGGHGLDTLPLLVARIRGTGLPVDLEVTGDPVELSPTAHHTLYRLVQEALTNIRKHAPGARATVRVVYEPATVRVSVLDDGPAPGGAEPGTTGSHASGASGAAGAPGAPGAIGAAGAAGAAGAEGEPGRAVEAGAVGSSAGVGVGVGVGQVGGGGFGLDGMAERVAGCGGWLRAGPREAGGFEVSAGIPVSAARNEEK